jgi:DNA helicase-2/ATP-dependent DNA helicase PcrA
MNNYRKTKYLQIVDDEKQRQAYYSKGNSAVIAGPGSGKTAVLTMKTMYLLENEINDPQGIACITYSREAVREIKDRLKLLGYNNTHRNSFFGTIHAFCIAEVLIPFARLFNYFKLPIILRIATKQERIDAFQKALAKLRFESRQVNIEEMNRERKLSIAGISNIEIPSYDIALQVAREYEEILHSADVIDFEDIVNYSTILISYST